MARLRATVKIQARCWPSGSGPTSDRRRQTRRNVSWTRSRASSGSLTRPRKYACTAWRCRSKTRVKTAASSRPVVILGRRDRADLLGCQQLERPDELSGRDQLADQGDVLDLLSQQVGRHVGVDVEPSNQGQADRPVQQLQEGGP